MVFHLFSFNDHSFSPNIICCLIQKWVLNSVFSCKSFDTLYCIMSNGHSNAVILGFLKGNILINIGCNGTKSKLYDQRL